MGPPRGRGRGRPQKYAVRQPLTPATAKNPVDSPSSSTSSQAATSFPDLLSTKNGFKALAGIEEDPQENITNEPIKQALGADPIPLHV
ncbi:unnamed protein product [Amaranthus hypochondriacus]